MQKELVILGAGESGVGAALLAKANSIAVFVSDKGLIAPRFKKELLDAGISFEEGQHSESRIMAASEVIKSPGIPDSATLIKALDAASIPVISDIEFALRYTKAHIIGITGSNGKTTTTLWLHHILQSAGFDAVLSGNVGVSPCRRLTQSDPAIFVMELSSFQLDRMYNSRINTAIITNITPDHLDRYNYRFEDYIEAKYRILSNQTEQDNCIWSADDPTLKQSFRGDRTAARSLPFALKAPAAAFVKGDILHVEVGNAVLDIPLDKIALKGRHNLYNAMALALAGLSLGVSPKVLIAGLSSFKGVEHRLEPCAELEGVLYINDSKATNVDSTWYALESMSRPVVWIAGGTDKGNDYSVLKEFAKQKVRALICMGVDNRKLIQSFEGVIPEVISTDSLDEALRAASNVAKKGDVVLLSPACASFDLFKNYEERGNLFRQKVMEMKKL